MHNDYINPFTPNSIPFAMFMQTDYRSLGLFPHPFLFEILPCKLIFITKYWEEWTRFQSKQQANIGSRKYMQY